MFDYETLKRYGRNLEKDPIGREGWKSNTLEACETRRDALLTFGLLSDC